MLLTSLFLSLSSAFADTLVILNSPDSKTKEVMGKVDDNAEFLTWSEIRTFPLAFGSVNDNKSCMGDPIPLKELEASLKSAESAVAYLETKNAIGHVRRIQSSLVCVNEPIPTSLLARSSYISGVAYNYDENLPMAKTSWQKALTYDSGMVWDDDIEPSGKAAFEDVKQNVNAQATTRLIFMPKSARLTVDGQPLKSGGDVIAGEHFIQHNALNNQGHLIQTDMGTEAYVVSFADFSEDLAAVMADTVVSNELLKAMLMVQDKKDVRVVTATDYWYLPMGTTKWKSQPLKYVPKSPKPSSLVQTAIDDKAEPQPVLETATATVPVQRDRSKTLKVAGASTMALGVISLGVAHGYWTKFDGYEQGEVTRAEFETVRDRNRLFWYTGAGLTAVGGGLVIGGTF